MQELEILKKYLIEQANLCVHQGLGNLKHRYVTPTAGITPGDDDGAAIPERSTIGHYLQMYDWDACFFSQAAWRAGIENLGFDVVANFLNLQQGNGFIPRTVSPNRTWDSNDCCKPFLCQTLLNAQLAATASSWPPENLDKLEKFLSYWQSARLEAHGLFKWRNVLESGVDDNLALLAPKEAALDDNFNVGGFPDARLLASDLSSYMFAEYKAFSSLLKSKQEIAKAANYERLASNLAEAIENILWSPELGLYCNFDPLTNQLIKLRSWTNLTPVFFNCVSEARACEVIERNVLNKEEFLRPAGLASMAFSESLNNQAKRGLYGSVIVSNWQGPVWILPNCLAVRCLIKYGYHEEAKDLATRVLRTLINCLATRGTLFENYHAETGAPLWAPNFISWNILALELIELF